MAAYDYLDQNIVATALIQAFDNDSFYNPTTTGHNGFAADGTRYTNGVQDAGPVLASWFSEFGSSNDPYRDDQAAFPSNGLILLSPVAMTILNESTPVPHANQLRLWMQFLMSDSFMMTNNFNQSLQGFTPSGLAYADGVISVTYTPDSGNQTPTSPPVPTDPAQSHMIVSIDFSQDSAYLDVAL